MKVTGAIKTNFNLSYEKPGGVFPRAVYVKRYKENMRVQVSLSVETWSKLKSKECLVIWEDMGVARE